MTSTTPAGCRRPVTRSPRSASKKPEVRRQGVAATGGPGSASSAFLGSGGGAAARTLAKKQPRALGRTGKKPSIYFDQTISKTADLTPEVNKDIKACSMRAQPFFDRTVKWVVTRRKDYAKFVVRHSHLDAQDVASPAAFMFSSGRALAGSEYNPGSPAEFGGPNAPTTRGVGSTRSKTMVHKASLQATSQASGNTGQDELALAQRLGIKVMSFFDFRRWLSENVPSRKQQHPRSSAATVAIAAAGPKGRPVKSAHSNLVLLRDEFIKIEDTSGRFRPIIKEVLKNSRGEFLFPLLNLDAAGSRCPFLPVKSSKAKPSASKSRSDRQSKRPQRRRELKGHCSNCGVYFKEGIEKHCATSEHRRFAENDLHFNKIDQFSMSRRLDLDSFVSKCIVDAKMDARGEAKKAEAGRAGAIRTPRSPSAPAANARMTTARDASIAAASGPTSAPAFSGSTIDTSRRTLKSVSKSTPSGESRGKARLPATLPGTATSMGQTAGKRCRVPSGADQSETVRGHKTLADVEVLTTAAGRQARSLRKVTAADDSPNSTATGDNDHPTVSQRAKGTPTQRAKRSPSAAAGATFGTRTRSPSPPLPSSFVFDQAEDAESSTTFDLAQPSRPARGSAADTSGAPPTPTSRGSVHAITISPTWGSINPQNAAGMADGTTVVPDSKITSKAGLTARLDLWKSHRAIKKEGKSKKTTGKRATRRQVQPSHARSATEPEPEEDDTTCEQGEGEAAPASHTIATPRMGAFQMFKKPTGRASALPAATTSSSSRPSRKPAPAAPSVVSMAEPNPRPNMTVAQKRAKSAGPATGPNRTSKAGKVAARSTRSSPRAGSGDPVCRNTGAVGKRSSPEPARSSPAASTRGRSRASYRPLTIEAPPPQIEETPMSYNLYPARVVKVHPNNRIHVMYADNDPPEGCEIPRSWAQKWLRNKMKPVAGTKLPEYNHDTDLQVGDHVGALVPELSTQPEPPESPATMATTSALNALSPNDDEATEIPDWDAGINSSPGDRSSAIASDDGRSSTPKHTSGSRRKLDYGNDDGTRANLSSGSRHRSNKRRKLDETPNPTTRGGFTDLASKPVLPPLVEDIDQPVLLPSRRRTSSETTSPPSPDSVPRPKVRKKGGTFSPARRSGGGSATKKRQSKQIGMSSRAPDDPYVFS